MSKRAKVIIFLVALAQIFAIVTLLALPSVVQAIPGRYRVRLPEQFVERFTAPLPTLPAPSTVSDRPQIDIPALSLEATPTATFTPEPTATSGTAVTATVAEAASPTPTPTDTPTETPTPKPLPERIRLEGMRVIAQTFNNCGPANLTQVLNFYGDGTTLAAVANHVKPNPEDRNVSPWQMSDYANQFSALRAEVYSGGDLEIIKRFLAAGIPVIIEKGYEPNTASAQGWMGHYLTMFGYDEGQQTFDTMDTYLGPFDSSGRTYTYDTIQHYWQHFNYLFIVVYEPGQEEVVHEILGPEMLDRTTMWQMAALKAQADVEAAPENAFAWFNLGTNLTELGIITGEAEYYENSAAAFDQARTIGLPPRMLWYQFRPFMAYLKTGRFDDMQALLNTLLATESGRNLEEIHWYRGHLLHAQGNLNGARSAYQQALQLNRNFTPAQVSLDYVNSLSP